MHLISNTICFVFITVLYARTLGVYFRRYNIKKTSHQWQPDPQQLQPHHHARGHRHHHGGQQHKQKQHAALWRLVLLLFCFETVWLLVIVNDLRTMSRGGGLETGMGDAPSTFMVREEEQCLRWHLAFGI